MTMIKELIELLNFIEIKIYCKNIDLATAQMPLNFIKEKL